MSVKKRTWPFFIIMLLCYLVGYAQQDPTSKKLLTDLSKKYQTYRTVGMTFTLKAIDQQQRVVVNQKGTLIVSPKSNQYHITFDDQEMISDGKQQWHILKEEQEVQLTAAGADEQRETITPANMLTFYDHGFKHIMGASERVGGKTLNVIDLTPLDNTKPYFKIRLRVDKSLNQIYDLTVFDKSGTHYIYAIQNFTPNVKITNKTFIFDQSDYPNMEVVDLR